MVQFYGPGVVNNPLYMAAIQANNPLLPSSGGFAPGNDFMQQYAFRPVAPVTIPRTVEEVAPVVETAPPPAPMPLQMGSDYNMGFPSAAPSFSPTYSPVAGYGPVDFATSPAAMASYGPVDFDITSPQTVAEAARDAAREQYGLQNPSPFSTLTNIFDQPIGTTVNNFLDAAFTPGNLPGMVTGSGILGAVANQMGKMNVGNLAYDRAMELQGQPGYSTGMIDGQMYSISPGLFGGRVMSGVVPDWFDISMAENMSAVSAGLDPESGTSLSGQTPQGGYNYKGEFVTPMGEVAALGTPEAVRSLAELEGISLQGARNALDLARSGKFSLPTAIMDIYNAERGYTQFEGAPNFDPGFDPNVPGAVPDINLDPLSAEMIDPNMQPGPQYAAGGRSTGPGGLSFDDPEGIEGFGVADEEDGTAGGLGY